MERVLLVEHERITNMALRDHLLEAGFEVEAVFCEASAHAAIERCAPSSLVIDLSSYADYDGFEVARFARLRRPDTRVVFVSSETEKHAPDGEFAGRVIITKPFRFEQIDEALGGRPSAAPKGAALEATPALNWLTELGLLTPRPA